MNARCCSHYVLHLLRLQVLSVKSLFTAIKVAVADNIAQAVA